MQTEATRVSSECFAIDRGAFLCAAVSSLDVPVARLRDAGETLHFVVLFVARLH
jgi:hypothetical protein